MIRRPFPTTPSYLHSIRALRDIHALTLVGREDSAEADAIRDGMDHPWYDLSEVEQRRIEGLSGDLYSISDPPRGWSPSDPQVERALIEVSEAQRAGEWDRALELLRQWAHHIDPAELAFLRGSTWREAGDNATADLFAGHAAQLDPYRFGASTGRIIADL